MSLENIIVTGFGPFDQHSVNASWESVKLLPDEIDGYNVIKQEIPVSYDTVDQKVQDLWKEYNPKLVVHVGVSSYTSKIQLETCANKEGYTRKDVHGNFPTKGTECSAECTESCISVTLDVNYICSHINTTTSVEAATSENAGRYLCEYILYTSLSLDKNKTMFIHVPPLGKPYSAEQLAEGLLEIIRCAVKLQKC